MDYDVAMEKLRKNYTGKGGSLLPTHSRLPSSMVEEETKELRM